jgi:hypothetical protein
MLTVGAADVKSMRFKLVLPASDGFAVGELEAKRPSFDLNAGRR